MAYSINGKTHTDHPLMDEIVNCCKIIFDGIVIKNDVKANEYETAESLEKGELFLEIMSGESTFDNFPFNKTMLESYSYPDGTRVFSDDAIKAILNNKYSLQEELREPLLDYCRRYFLSQYVEKNNYYRSLAGLPPYTGTVYNIKRERSDTEYNIYVYPSDFPDDYDISNIDFSKPLHTFATKDISILQMTGFIDSLIEDYKGFEYSYLRYLGNKSIDFYTSRKASKWEILYIPKVEELIEERFKEIYNINKTIYLKRTYQEAYTVVGRYYDESIILLLLCQTFTDLIAEIPEWYIRRDIFDIRSVQYFLESFGVKFFDEIPLKYQISIVKNLNKLIKYKSSMKNNNDILDIFNLTGVYIYKYYLYKERLNDTDDDSPENYDLKFIKYKQGDSIDKYLNDNIYRFPYDDLTLQDKYWDGVYNEWDSSIDFKEKVHEIVEEAHKYQDFTLEGTKYMSIDYEIDMSKFQYQSQYFLNYILDSNIENDIGIIVPSIDANIKINISNLFLFLQLITFSYDNMKDIIRRPEDTNKHKETIISDKHVYYEQVYKDDGDYDDYIKWNYMFNTVPKVNDFDTNQFDFSDINYKPIDENDDYEFDYENIEYPSSEYTETDFNEYLYDDIDEGYDFTDPHFSTEDPPDDGVYNFDDLLENPDNDQGYDFNIVDPYEDWDPTELKKSWEVKSYIENYDPIATAAGYNSFPIYYDNRDWIERNIPEALITAYNYVNGFNTSLTNDDMDKLMDFIKTRSLMFNFEHGYLGYSYNTIVDTSGETLYYEITYEFDDSDLYTYQEYLIYVDSTVTEDDYNEWKDDQIREFLRVNPKGPLGIAGYRVLKKINTIELITESFDINTACYKDLYNRIIQSDNRDKAIFMRYIFNKLFTKEFDYNYYKKGDGSDAEYLSEVLKDKDYILYNYYITIISESNIETRKANIRSIMNDIITTLEYYLSGDNIEYIYSTFSISSFSSLLKYIYLLIGFFKSYKVYFLDPVVTYKVDDKLENGLSLGSGVDQISEKKINYWKEDKMFSRDVINKNLILYYTDKTGVERYKEIVDIYGHFDPDPRDDMNYDGYYPDNVDRIDLNGGVPDSTKNIPFIMVNGGTSYKKLLDVFDLDGGGPHDMNNYLSLDGGGPFHNSDLIKKDNWESAFSFIIDAGNPGTNQFITRNIHTKVIDRQISQDLLISNKEGNVIKSDNGAIYIEQAWVSWEEYNNLIEEADKSMNIIDYAMNVVYGELLVITDEELLEERINSLINEDMNSIRKVTRYVENIDSHRNELKAIVDDKIAEFEGEIEQFSPYSWSDF